MLKLKKAVILGLSLICTLGFMGCSDKSKEIILSNDSKKELNAANSQYKFSKLKELSISPNIDPIIWKDDNDIIAIEKAESKVNIYNLNVTDSKTTLINTLNVQHISEWGNKDKLVYMQDGKFGIYDLKTNTSKVIYGLEDVEKEIRESNYVPSKDISYSSAVSMGLVRGSDKYMYIVDKFSNDKKGTLLRIIDLETGKVIIKSTPAFEINPYMFVYSKYTNSIYTQIFWGTKDGIGISGVYQYKLDNPQVPNKVEKLNYITDITKDGKMMYTVNPTGNGILKYDLQNDKLTEVINLRDRDGLSKNESLSYSSVDLSSTGNFIYYGEVQSSTDSNISKGSMYIGCANGDKISGVRRISIEEPGTPALGSIVFDAKDNQFIFKYCYSDGSNGALKYKYYIYGVQKDR